MNLPKDRRFIYEMPFFINYMGSQKLFFLITALAAANILLILPSAILGYLIAALLFLAAYKVAFEVMVDVADGHFVYRDKYSFGFSETIGFKAMAMPILQLIIFITLSRANPALATALILVLAFMTPAYLMLLAQTDHVISAMNPIDWVEIVQRLGLDYWLLVICWAVLGGLNMVLQFVLVDVMPLWLENIVTSFILYYLLVFSFLVMGYVIYHNAHELDHTPHDTEDTRTKQDLAADDPIKQRIESLLAEGDADSAMAIIKEMEKEGRDDLGVLAHQARDALQIGQRTSPKARLSELLAQRQFDEALKLWQSYHEDGHRLTPEPAAMKSLIIHCHEKKKHPAMMTLINGLDKQYPNEPQLVVDAFYLAAQVLYQNNKQAQAAKILQTILTRYKDRADVSAPSSYYKGLEKMGKI